MNQELEEMKSWVLANAQQSRRPEFSEKIIAALDELEEVRARNNLFVNFQERALKMWQTENPSAEYWPDTAFNIAWVMRQVDLAKVENATLRKQKDYAYKERDQLVAALSKLFPAGLERHVGENWEDDWRWIVFINLPTGQVSWHIHDSELPEFNHLPRETGFVWDLHSTEEKYKRLAALELLRSDV